MFRIAFAASLVSVCLISSAPAQSLNSAPVHAHPVWQQVQAPANSSANQVAVQSLSTHQVIGAVPVGYKFMSFGRGDGIITMAFNGEIGYLPASVVAPLYPSTTPPPKAPAGENTLETLANNYEAKVKSGAGVNLHYSGSIVEKVKQRQTSLNAQNPGAVGNTPIQDVGINQGPNSIMPGATLATGGPQALGGMVGAPPHK